MVNFLPKLNENAWVAAGSVVGLAAGAGTNLLKTGSFFRSNISACVRPFNDSIPLQAINEIRQGLVHSTNLFSPIFPLVHTVPMLASSAWNTLYPNPEDQDKSFLERGWQNLSKQVINPLLQKNVLLYGSLAATNLMSSSLNPSRHVIFHAANMFQAMKSLEGLKDTGSTTQKKIYSLLNVGIALTDAVWMYNTASNCDSVANIAAGVACVGVGLLGLQAGKAIASTGYNLVKDRFSPISQTSSQETKHPLAEEATTDHEKKSPFVETSPTIESPVLSAENVINNESLRPTVEPLPQTPTEPTDQKTSEAVLTAAKVNSSVKDHKWLLYGTLAGLTLGSLVNFAYTGSLMERDSYRCKNSPFGGIEPLIGINNFREIGLSEAREGDWNLVSPIFPLVYVLPMTAVSLWNIIRPSESESGLKKLASRSWKQISKNNLTPLAYNVAIAFGGFLFRETLFNHSQNTNLDVSGHVVCQLGLNLLMIKSLQALSQTGTPSQQKTISALFAAMVATDAVWMFNTSANCHSVADVLAGSVCAVLPYTSIEGAKFVFGTAYNATTNATAATFNFFKSKILSADKPKLKTE